MDHAQDNLTLSDAWEILSGDKDIITFKEALLFTQNRIPVTKDEFKQLSDEVKFRSFTVAALTEYDQINTMKNQIRVAIEKGSTLTDFIKRAEKDIAELSEVYPGYMENVFRTNMQSAYSAGRELQFKKNPPEYVEIQGIEDTRQCDICGPRDGIILTYDDPWWADNIPPYHFQCRCHRRGISKEEAEILGVKQTDATNLPTDKPLDGFGGNPLKEESFFNITKDMARRAIEYNIDGDIAALARELEVPVGIKNMVNNYPIFKDGQEKLPKNSFVKVSPNKMDPNKKYSQLNPADKLEIDAAFILAKKGNKVYMLPGTTAKGIKSSDLFVNGKTLKNSFVEIKNVTGNIKTIETQIQKAFTQANNYFFIINNPSITESLLRDVLKGKLRNKNTDGLFIGILNDNYFEWQLKYILK